MSSWIQTSELCEAVFGGVEDGEFGDTESELFSIDFFDEGFGDDKGTSMTFKNVNTWRWGWIKIIWWKRKINSLTT